MKVNKVELQNLRKLITNLDISYNKLINFADYAVDPQIKQIFNQAAKDSLDEDEFLINDLIGMEVYQKECFAGVVTGVSNNGASDLLSVKTKSDNICLVPFVKAIVTHVDIKSRKIVLADLEGLLEWDLTY